MANGNLIGRIYGDFYVYDFDYERAKNYQYYYRCRCINCGFEKDIESSALKAGKCIICKCNHNFNKMKYTKGYRTDLSGQKFGHLTVNSFSHKYDSHSYWNCTCDLCGKDCIKSISYLKKNQNQMCTDCAKLYHYDNEDDIGNTIEQHDEYVIINGNIIFDMDDLDLILSYNRHICINSNGYAYFTYHGKECFLHRLIMGLPIDYDEETQTIVDHINGNRLDNRKSNLRICNKNMNPINCKIYKNNTSGCKGVSWMPRLNKWQVSLNYKKQRIYLGVYSDYDEAVKIRKEAEKEYFKEFNRSEDE